MAQGLLIPASEEHYKAAEAFEAAYQASTEENVRGASLQSRVIQNSWPFGLPPSDEADAANAVQRAQEGGEGAAEEDCEAAGREQGSVTPAETLQERNPDQRGHACATGRAVTGSANTARQPLRFAANGRRVVHAAWPARELQYTPSRSFNLTHFTQSEPGDAFNHFWKITEGMLDYLSQPVAFATAPLSPPDSSRRDGNGSDTDVEDPISKTLSRGLDFVKAAKSRMLTRHDSSANMSDSDAGRAGINSFPPKPLPIDDWDDDLGDGASS